MHSEEANTGIVALGADLIAQINAQLSESGVETAEAFVRRCVEKELKAQREAGEKALAERLRGLGYLE